MFYSLICQIQVALFDFESFQYNLTLPIHLHFLLFLNPHPLFKKAPHTCVASQSLEVASEISFFSKQSEHDQRPQKAMQFCQGHMKQQMAELISLYYNSFWYLSFIVMFLISYLPFDMFFLFADIHKLFQSTLISLMNQLNQADFIYSNFTFKSRMFYKPGLYLIYIFEIIKISFIVLSYIS